jgi:phage terminase large subunit
MSREITVPLQPKQGELLKLVEESPSTWIGYGGSRGGAKSHGARAVMLLRRWTHAGTRGLIFRRTYEQLWENHIQPLFAQYPFMRGWFHTGHRELTLPNGSVIAFGYAEHPGDISNFQGKEYMDIAVDEATHLTEAELMFLRTCNRWPGVSPKQCKMILTMNPGGVGHAFVKRVFIDKQCHENESPDDYVFLQARAWDNCEWARAALAEANLTEKDYYGWPEEERFNFFIEKTDYGRTLNKLPKSMRNGHLLGSWDKFSGQYFDVFDLAKHVHRVQSFELKSWLPRWIAIDWGFAHHSVVEWACQDGEITRQYREYKVQGLGPSALAHEIVDRSKGEKIEAVFLSPDAFAHRTSESSIAEQIGAVLTANGLPFPAEADNDRVGGWMLMYEMLHNGTWQIGDNCQALIETLPMLTRDEKKPEDGIKFDGDDALDATRYLLYSRLHTRQAPQADRIEERVALAEFTDSTSEMIWRRKWAKQEAWRSQPIQFGRRGINRRKRMTW